MSINRENEFKSNRVGETDPRLALGVVTVAFIAALLGCGGPGFDPNPDSPQQYNPAMMQGRVVGPDNPTGCIPTSDPNVPLCPPQQ